MNIEKNTKLFIAGHRGMVGSAIIRKLLATGHNPECIITRTRKELDLCNQQAVNSFFSKEKIDSVVLAAAKVGGIHANNTYPAEFIYTNIMIQANIIHGAYLTGIKELLFLGSSCIYPKLAPQPIKEEYLLTGLLEPTNEPYALAKIAGIKMCEAYNRQYGTSYRSVMPTNLYGPGDNYHLENSHVIPAMIRKFHLAKLAIQGDLEAILKDEFTYGFIPAEIKDAIGLDAQSTHLKAEAARAQVILWGTGQVYREFLHVDDMATACIFTMNLDQSLFSPDSTQLNTSFLNVGIGEDQTIEETANMIKKVVGFKGEVVFDSSKPSGTPKKLLDTKAINTLGWKAEYDLQSGLENAYNSYLEKISS